ncbi:hypothetical protein F2Q69_00031135 [Brassica cretica]|uniref:Uncharacterized protein n=1 Tax=Brassica cretica TaxID=69181 RepID=A0A8S9SAU2_BRACR|nr:hypothetical protein F2Q69_00031135 [Brassica cretica]
MTDIVHPTSIDTPVRTSTDNEPRDMVATLIHVRDERGDMHDQEGHLRNAAGQRIDAHGAAILEYMPSSTRSNKETQLLFSPDPASLERTTRKEARSSSIDNNTCTRSFKFGAFDPQRSTLLIDRQQHLFIARFRSTPSTHALYPSTDTRSPPSTEDTHLT